MSIEAAQGGAGWTAGHEQEHVFQVKKRAKKELQALEDGVLLQHEIRPGMQEALIEMKKRDKGADAKTKRTLQQTQSRRTTAKLTLKAGTVVCISVSESVEDLTRVLRSRGCLLADQLSLKTQLLVVGDPACLDKSQKWIAALSGVLVCSAEAVLSLDNCIGPFVKFRAATASNRKLHLSQDFQAKHVWISNLLREACQLPSSCWRMSAAACKGCVVLGGEHGKTARNFLKSITCVLRAESRAR